MYTGIYYGVMYVNHIYKPTEDITKLLLRDFKHKWNIGQSVKFRKPHRRTDINIIKNIGYSTERFGGGTIKVYSLGNEWLEESLIKSIVT